MGNRDILHYRYRGARALVFLHEAQLRAFLPVWRLARASGVSLPLAEVEEKRFAEAYQTRWAETLSIEAMLEHAVVHPMRHVFPLEELGEAP